MAGYPFHRPIHSTTLGQSSVVFSPRDHIMKRVLPLIIIGVIIMILGVTGFSVALFYIMGGHTRNPEPFTAQQLMDMVDEPDKVKKDIPRVIACFEVDDELAVLAADALKHGGPKAVD